MTVLDRLLEELRADRAAGSDRARARPRRRAAGAFFTPMPLVRHVVAEALAARWARRDVPWRADGSPELVVLDPAAGDGRFLAAAAEGLADLAAARGFDRARARRAILRRCLIGLERDPAFAAEAARVLPGARIERCEALLGAPALPPADLVVGNPPYVRSIHLRNSDPELWTALRGRFAATSYKEWDLYAAFIERALRWAAPAGEVALVTPSRWLTAAYAARLRAQLAAAGAVRAVMDFGAEQIFDGVTTYASVVFMQVRPPHPGPAPASRGEGASEQGARASVRAGGQGARGGVQVARLSDRGWATGTVSAGELGGEPWRLVVGAARAKLARAAARGPRLGEVAAIVKGAGTNADPVYVLERRGRRYFSPALEREVAIEAGVLRPCLRGRDVPVPGAELAPVWCLVPYDRDGRLLAADLLARRYPKAWAYLLACRPLLEARERGRFRGERFYQFGRPQNLAFLADPAPKLVVPDVAREARAFLDTCGCFVLDTAYALRPRPGAATSLESLHALLCSPLATLWLRETGVPLRGGYLRMKTAYLSDLPVAT